MEAIRRFTKSLFIIPKYKEKNVLESDKYNDIVVLDDLRKILEFFYILPKTNNGKTHYKGVIFLLCCVFVEFGGIYFVVANVSNVKISLYAEALYGVICTVANIASSLPLMVNGPKYKKLFKDLGNYSIFGRPKFAKHRTDYVHFILRWYYVLCVVLIIQFLLGGVFSTTCETKKQIYDLKIICGLGLDIYYPINFENDTIEKYILIIINGIIVTIVYSIGYMYCAAFMAVSELLIIKIEHLTLKIDKISAKNNALYTKKKLINCVKYHIHVTDLSKLACICYKIHITIFPILTSSVLALSLYCITLEFSWKSLNFIFTVLFAVLFVNWTGQRLLNKSEILYQAICKLPWYTSTLHDQKLIFMMLKRSQTYCKLSGQFLPLSMEACMQIFSKAYSYLALLKSFS